jgi:hypothetical protein
MVATDPEWAVKIKSCLLLLMTATLGFSQAPTPSLPQIGEMMKPYLVDALPKVLYEHNRSWGRTTMAMHAIRWHGLRPEIEKTPHNDGHWQKLRIVPRDPRTNLAFSLSEPKVIDADRRTFKAYVAFVAGLEYEQQLWEKGVRLYSGSTRAHVRVQALLDVESTLRWDTSKSAIPDLVLRLKITKATVRMNDFVVEHTAGIGGTGAKLIGEGIEGIVKEAQPGLQERLQERMEAALVKAGDTRDIRLGFGALFGSKAPNR